MIIEFPFTQIFAGIVWLEVVQFVQLSCYGTLYRPQLAAVSSMRI